MSSIFSAQKYYLRPVSLHQLFSCDAQRQFRDERYRPISSLCRLSWERQISHAPGFQYRLYPAAKVWILTTFTLRSLASRFLSIIDAKRHLWFFCDNMISNSFIVECLSYCGQSETRLEPITVEFNVIYCSLYLLRMFILSMCKVLKRLMVSSFHAYTCTLYMHWITSMTDMWNLEAVSNFLKLPGIFHGIGKIVALSLAAGLTIRRHWR